MTKSGKVPNAPCIFPWKYGDDDIEYDGCANPSLSSVGDWCPTELDNEGKYISGSAKWGACAESCPKSKNKPNRIDCESNEECESGCCSHYLDRMFFLGTQKKCSLSGVC